MNVLPYGRAALLVEPDEPGDVLAVAAALGADPDVVEVVPAARTVLVRADPRHLAALRLRIESLRVCGPPPAATEREPVVLDVVYDGADLAETAHEVGTSVDELVRLHTAARHVVAFCGFAPGFAYLSGVGERLHVPRRAEPRTRVPAGSVAIAGGYTGIYPRPSPGGWRLLGRTDADLWDPRRDEPSLLAPGTPVRLRAR